MQRPRQLSPDTVTVKVGRPAHEPDAPLNPPVVLALTYVAGGDLEYGRSGNPTWAAFEEALGANG
jgi:cystathionine gamma-synthase